MSRKNMSKTARPKANGGFIHRCNVSATISLSQAILEIFRLSMCVHQVSAHQVDMHITIHCVQSITMQCARPPNDPSAGGHTCSVSLPIARSLHSDPLFTAEQPREIAFCPACLVRSISSTTEKTPSAREVRRDYMNSCQREKVTDSVRDPSSTTWEQKLNKYINMFFLRKKHQKQLLTAFLDFWYDTDSGITPLICMFKLNRRDQKILR